MTVDLSSAEITPVLERADMLPAPAEVLAQLEVACRDIEGHADGVLEVSQAIWLTETRSVDVLIVLTRKSLVLVGMTQRGLFKPAAPSAVTVLLADYTDLGDLDDDDELPGPSVMFISPDERRHFILSWSDEGERHRMYRAMFEAHRGLYSRWGLQLDPSNYVADFDRYYAQIVQEGPAAHHELYHWVEGQFGEFDMSNALGFAIGWRGCELRDAEGADPSSRVACIAFPSPWIDAAEGARRLVVLFGEQLFNEGLLAPPYDERSFDTDEPLSQGDAGPARLIALMTLAAHARSLVHPRAGEWIEAARAGIPSVPPMVFSENLRKLWSGIDGLPAVDDGPPPEIPIWDDVDVRAIVSSMQGDPPRPVYAIDGLTEADAELVRMFFGAEERLKAADSLDGDSVTRVCLLGVRAFEGLSGNVPLGWRKLILYAVSDLTYDLWEKHQIAQESAALAHWVIASIEANHWGPDGRKTPLGQHHSYAMGVAVRSGIGTIQIDPVSGLAKAPTGDEARRAAVAGHF